MCTAKLILLFTILIAAAGCTSGSWWQAKLMSGADTKQAILLEESQDPKKCVKIEGQGSYLGVTGQVKILEARGKNISFQDCINAFNNQLNPVVLP